MLDNLIKKFIELHWGFYVLLLIVLVLIFRNPEISLTIFASLVFASSLNPLADKLSKRMPRGIAVSVVLFTSIGLLGVLLIPLILSCVYEIGSFAIAFPSYVNNIGELTNKYPLLHQLGLEKVHWDSMFSSAETLSANAINDTILFVRGLSSIFLYLLLTVIFTFYLMIDREHIKQSALELFPKTLRNQADNIIETITKRLGGYIIAQACAITSVGIVMLIGLLVFRIPYAPILALITMILDIIPVVGPALALIICIISASETGIMAVVVVCVTFSLAQLIENNAVRPYAFGKLLNIHPMLIFIALFIATKYLGIAGTLFAPAIAATLCVLVDELYKKNLK